MGRPRYPETSPAQNHSGEGPFLTGDPNALYQHYFQRLLAVATTRYRWLGFGPWIDPMRVEWLLVTQGVCAFTHVRNSEGLPSLTEMVKPDATAREKGEGMGYKSIQSDRLTVTQVAVTGFLDDTYTPSSYRTYGPNGAGNISFNTNLPIAEWKGVPIWGDANRSRYDAGTIALFARRLAQGALVVDTNMRQTMRGKVIGTSQDKLKSSQIMVEAFGLGYDVFTTPQGASDLEMIKALDLGVHPDTVEASHRVLMRLWAEALEALGVESPAAEKRERMIVDEVNGDASQIAAIRRLTLTPRRRAAELINRRYFSGEPVVEVIDQW